MFGNVSHIIFNCLNKSYQKLRKAFLFNQIVNFIMTLYVNACKVTFVPLIKDSKFDIEVMSTSNDNCEKAMKGNFFQKNHAEANAGKKTQPLFFDVFNGFHLKNSKQYREDCPEKKRLNSRNTNVTLPNTSR